MRKGCKI